MPPKKKPRRMTAADFFITTVPVIRPCSRCGSWLAAGISEGMHIQADLAALDPEQTILAMLVRLRLFCLTRTGLVELDTYRLRDDRFPSRLPEHRCGMAWPARLPGAGPVVHPSKSETPPY